MEDDELKHYGVLGMHWGVRRYQKKDGSLTRAGQKRYNSTHPDSNYRSGNASGNTRKAQKSAKRKATFEKVFDQNIKNGKDKAPISAAEKISKNVSSAIDDDTTRIYRSASNIKNRKKKKPDYSKMTDQELREKINRMDLERRYSNLKANEIQSGKIEVEDVLNIVGGVAGITGSVVGTIAIINSLKK